MEESRLIQKAKAPVLKLAESNRIVRGLVALAVAVAFFFGVEAVNLDSQTLSQLVTAALGLVVAYVLPLLVKIDLPGEWDDKIREAVAEWLDKEARSRAETDQEGVKVPPPSDDPA